MDYTSVMHPTDLSALNAMKKIKGFDKVVDFYMKYGAERIRYMQNMGNNIKLGPNQIPEVYDLLPPICEKFGMAVPELYLTYSRLPGACSYGENQPYINISCGLIETCTTEEIQTAMARECGHIACHHGLYTGVGALIMGLAGGIDVALIGPMSAVVSALLAAGFYKAYAYWLRSSDLTADRFAAVWNGSSEGVIRYIARNSGLLTNLNYSLNEEEYVTQFKQFKKYKDEANLNKVLHFLEFSDNSTYTDAERTLALNEWCQSEEFNNILKNGNTYGLESDRRKFPRINSSVNYCPYCGSKIENEARFCTHCGKRIGE